MLPSRSAGFESKSASSTGWGALDLLHVTNIKIKELK
jgi:hypothetical protein